MPMKNILILCTGNSCRSQIAHGYFAHFGKQNLKVYSAGIETHGVNPKAIATMADDGIDISGHTSNHVDEYLHIPFDYILTVCDHAQENCPLYSEPDSPSDSSQLYRSLQVGLRKRGRNQSCICCN